MLTILGLLGFYGLTVTVYWLFYRLLWSNAIDRHTVNRTSEEGKGELHSGEGKPSSQAPLTPGCPSAAAGHYHQSHIIPHSRTS